MYKPIYDKTLGSKKIAEITTWSLLLFLLPTTALGFFAEQSIPGQALFPIKLTIEHTVLALQFLSPSSQASYSVGLVNTRFNEVQTLLTMDTSNGEDFSNFNSQLQDATNYIVSLPDSPEKTQLKDKLLSNIQLYQNQLQQQQQTIENKQQIQEIQQLQQYQFPQIDKQSDRQNPTATPLPQQNTQNNATPTPPPPTQNPNSQQDVIDQLNYLQQQMDQATNNLTNNTSNQIIPPTPTITDIPTNSPIDTPTDTPTSTPYLFPTSSDTPIPYDATSCGQNNGFCASNTANCQGDNYSVQYSFPYSCNKVDPICCIHFAQPSPTPTFTPTPYKGNHRNGGGDN